MNTLKAGVKGMIIARAVESVPPLPPQVLLLILTVIFLINYFKV